MDSSGTGHSDDIEEEEEKTKEDDFFGPIPVLGLG